MGELFEVEPSPSRLVVDKEGRGRVHFRVKNSSDREVQMQAQVVAEKRSEASWFAIDGQAGRTLAKGGVGTVVVDVAVPPGTRPGDDYGLALQVADASAAGSRPERGPGVTMDVNRRDEPHGRGVLATTIGAILGGVIGFLVALGLGGYEIGHGVYQGFNSGWTVGHTVTHIVTSIFWGLVITVVFGLLAPWAGELLGSGLALRIRRHWGIRRTLLLLAIATPVWSVGAAIVLIIVFKAIPGTQIALPILIWLVTLLLVPPIFSRLTAVGGRQHAH
jgi:hypothetical protein